MAAGTEAAERLGIVAHSDGPFVPVQTRSERPKSTRHDDFPAVEPWQAEWKLTPIERIRDLIDGTLDGSPYPIQYPDVADTTVEWIDRTDSRIGSAGIPEERAAANGWTSFEKA
ncbi:MAG TPA: Fe-S cluster assembly protein SufD, partial [Pseudolysinimonas sp.]|nr:Fe-S cluster assembly protein SufD [Pseudolysinimonas sp.]